MICVILEEGELTKTISQKTVTVILMEGERSVVKKKNKHRKLILLLMNFTEFRAFFDNNRW